MSDSEIFYSWLHRQGGLTDETQGEIMHKLMELRPHISMVYTWDDIGMSNLIYDTWGDTMRFSPRNESWYLWEENQWVKQPIGNAIHDRLATLLTLLLFYCKEQAWLVDNDEEIKQDEKEDMLDSIKAYEKYIKSIRKYHEMENIIKELKTSCIMNLSEMDTNPYLLNTTHLAYDLRTGRVIDDITPYNVTKCALTYMPTEGLDPICDRWYSFIDEIMSHDKEKAKFLQRALGYSLLGVNKEECMFIAYGSRSRNGKGTLFRTLEKVLGEDYLKASAPDLILERRNGGSTDFNAPQPALASLVGVRMVNMSESDRGQRLHAGAMKAMTGRDTLAVRGLYESTFRFSPEFTLWLNTNYLPAITDDTVFLSNRIWVIEFNEHYDEDNRDTDLKELFSDPDNLPTILKWLMDGAVDYCRNGLNPPEVVRKATANYRRLHDRIGSFIEDCCETGVGKRELRSNMYRAYRNWCNREDNRFTPIGSSTFYEELAVRGYGAMKTNGEYYILDLTLKEGTIGGVRITL